MFAALQAPALLSLRVRPMETAIRPLAIELCFDPESDQRLRRVWSRLSAFYGGPQDSELGVRPHITLALFRNKEPEGIPDLAMFLASRLEPFGLRLATVEQFSTTEGVVYLRPEPSAELARAHDLLQELLGQQRDLVHTYYRPGAWHPHCTVAINVPASFLDLVISECRSPQVLGDVQVVRLQVVRYRPATEIVGALLGQHATV